MATLTPTNLTFNTQVDRPAAVNFSASDVIDTSNMATKDLLIEIDSAAEAGENNLVLTLKAGIGTNAVADKAFTIEPTEKVLIAGAEAARFVNIDGKIDTTAVLSGGSGGALSDYSVYIFNMKP